MIRARVEKSVFIFLVLKPLATTPASLEDWLRRHLQHTTPSFISLIHGILNAVSWGILLPVGVIIARYLKTFPYAVPAWFYLHLSCHLSAYILGVAGWGIGLKLEGESEGVVYTSHRNIRNCPLLSSNFAGMDKSWMRLGETTKGRFSSNYADGVTAFLESAKRVVDMEGKIRCPCNRCMNIYLHHCPVVGGHLIAHGIMQAYTVWNYHGEPRASTVRVEVQTNELGGIDALVEDRIRAENMDHDGAGEQNDRSHNESVLNIDKLLSDASMRCIQGPQSLTCWVLLSPL